MLRGRRGRVWVDSDGIDVVFKPLGGEANPVIVTATRDGTHVIEADDFSTLHLQADGSDEATTAIARLGRRADSEHVFIPVTTLVTLAGPASDQPGWRGGFDAMIGYARKRGWVDDEGAVRLHIEPTG
jgi:hypothetical protein